MIEEMVIDHHRSLIDYPYLVLWTVETEVGMQGISSIGKGQNPVTERLSVEDSSLGIGN